MPTVTRTLPMRNLTLGSIMKILFISNLIVWSVFGAIVSVAAYSGAASVKWEDDPVTGIPGLLLGLTLASILCIAFTAVTGLLTHIGILVYSRIRPDATIAIENFENSSEAEAISRL